MFGFGSDVIGRIINSLFYGCDVPPLHKKDQLLSRYANYAPWIPDLFPNQEQILTISHVILYYKLTHPVVTMCYFAC